MESVEKNTLEHLKKITDVRSFGLLMNEVAQYEIAHPWYEGRARTVRAQQHTQSIPLRRHSRALTLEEGRHAQKDYLILENYPYFKKTYAFMEGFARSVGGTLSRAMVVSLESGKEVYEHVDTGEYYKIRDRYHLVLSSENGSFMYSGGESAVFKEGELWWFDNKVPHGAKNESTERRIHLIFDVLKGRSSKILIIHFLQKIIASRIRK